MSNLSLKSKNIRLVPFDQIFFEEAYKWYINVTTIDLFLKKEHILSKEELYDYLMDKKLQILLFIVPIEKDTPVGCIYSYKYNQTDGYLYTKIFIKNEDDKIYTEAFDIFYNYLFTYFPIRKIYYEEYEYNKKNIRHLKDFNFNLECCLKKYKFYSGEYYDKYIFTLFRKDFYEKEK